MFGERDAYKRNEYEDGGVDEQGNEASECKQQ